MFDRVKERINYIIPRQKRGYWRNIDKCSGIFELLNENFVELLRKHPESLPDLSLASTILVSSDYSGEQPGSRYSVLSFLFTDIDEFLKWDEKRIQLRQKFFSDKRRISFKGLNDKQKKQALKSFLAVADELNGLSFSIAIHSSIKTLFEGEAPLNFLNPDFARYKQWKPVVLEKAFRAAHFVSFMLAGLATLHQNIIWFSDEDSIAANPERLQQLTYVLGWIMSLYVDFEVGHVRCGTTKNDDGTLVIEDFTAIPDLIAGALNEQLNKERNKKIFYFSRGDYTKKTTDLTLWICDTSKSLKRIVCFLDPSDNSDNVTLSWFDFQDLD